MADATKQLKPEPKTGGGTQSAPSGPGAPARQMKEGLRGLSYDEQVQKLTPGETPVQTKPEPSGKAPKAPKADKVVLTEDTPEAVVLRVLRQKGLHNLTADLGAYKVGQGQGVLEKMKTQASFMTDLMSLLAASSTPDIDNPKHPNRVVALINQRGIARSVVGRICAQATANIRPQDVMGMALDASKGDYALAVLGAHNALKYLCYGQRTGVTSPAENAAIDRLGHMRASKGADKMGPWYHYFVPLVGQAWTGPTMTRLLTSGEHMIRSEPAQGERQLMNHLFEKLGIEVRAAISKQDSEKSNADEVGIATGKMLSVKNSSFAESLATTSIDAIAMSTDGYRMLFQLAGHISGGGGLSNFAYVPPGSPGQ